LKRQLDGNRSAAPPAGASNGICIVSHGALGQGRIKNAICARGRLRRQDINPRSRARAGRRQTLIRRLDGSGPIGRSLFRRNSHGTHMCGHQADGVKRGWWGEIVSRFERKGLRLAAMKMWRHAREARTH
jgi:hypothetical protein